MIEQIYNWVSGNAIEKAWAMGVELFIKQSESKHERPKAYADLSRHIESTPVKWERGWESFEAHFSENMWQCSSCDALNDTSGGRIVRTCHRCSKPWQEVAMFVPGSPMRRLIDNATIAATSSTYQAVGYYNS